MQNHFDTVIIGAGAAGMAAATMFASMQKNRDRVAVIEAHNQVGGCAGYFARGFPRRFHDAGATQLIEVLPGGLQHSLLALLGGAHLLPSPQKISYIEHLWPDGTKLRLNDELQVEFFGQAGANEELILPQAMQQLEAFLAVCAKDAELMWELFYQFPVFPLQSFADLRRLCKQALHLPIRDLRRLTLVLGKSVAEVAQSFGLNQDSKAWQILGALLLDTSQNTPERTPYLVGAMGLSILKRGIYRFPSGMADLFRPWASLLKLHGIELMLSKKVTNIQLRAARSGKQSFGFVLNLAGQQQISARSLVCTIPLANTLALFQGDAQMQKTPEFCKWQKMLRHGFEWKAFALYGVIFEKQNMGHEWFRTENPHYCQIFALPGEEIQEALYFSLGCMQREKRSGEVFRCFTATVHFHPALPCNASERQRYRAQLIARIENQTAARMSHVEDAAPGTFERYTSRPGGKVGGFAAGFENFLTNAVPSLAEPLGSQFPMALAGDSLFPGQGVIAASLSGILAWHKITGQEPEQVFQKYK